MTTFYQILQVPRDADALRIKKAFRARVKELHPDVNAREGSNSGEEDIHLLLEAYEVLSDPVRRQEYDRSLGPGGVKSGGFNYREWLQARPDAESQSKLIFYDLLRQRESDALELYGKMTEKRAFSLEKSLGKEDFMDCAFLLAEQFEARGDYSQALFLYLRICELEEKRAYFRHFFGEVEDRLRNLVCNKITWQVGKRLLITLLPRFTGFDFTAKTKAALWKKQAVLLEEEGEGWEARRSLKKALELAPKDSGLQRLAREWGV